MTLPSRPLGRSGLSTSTLALGTMMFGAWGNPSYEDCAQMVDLAIDGGITLFDTADIYDFGVSEEYLGRALEGRRDGVSIATKVGNAMSDDPLERGLSPRWIRHQCEASLRRLRTDRIDLYQFHRPDPTVPIAESIGAMQELVDEGKVRAIGTSTFSADQLNDVYATTTAMGGVGFATEQPPYSIFVRGIEADVLPVLRRHEVTALVWAPLNGGWLTGKYRTSSAAGTAPDSRAVRQPDHFDHGDGAMRELKSALVERLAHVADGAGVTLTQLALGFVLHDPTVAAALVGPRTPDQLRELLAAGHVALPADVIAALDLIVPPTTTLNPTNAV